jgi:hypothetical protein
MMIEALVLNVGEMLLGNGREVPQRVRISVDCQVRLRR